MGREDLKASTVEAYSEGRSVRGDNELECEEELLKQCPTPRSCFRSSRFCAVLCRYNAGGFPYVTLRLGNVFGPKDMPRALGDS